MQDLSRDRKGDSTMKKEDIDIDATRRFLSLFEEDKHMFHLLPESQKAKADRLPVKTLFGSFGELAEILYEYNLRGYAVCFLPNKTDGKGIKSENIQAIRSLFIDEDTNRNLDYALRPSVIVKTARGQHAYWLIDPASGENQNFSEYQRALIEHYKTDPSIKNINRAMRLPGFLHMKNDPMPVELLECSMQKYKLSEVIEAHKKKIDFDSFAAKMPTQNGPENRYGGRNNTALLLTREALATGQTPGQIKRHLHNYAQSSGLDPHEIEGMTERQLSEHQRQPFVSFFHENKEVETARRFLDNLPGRMISHKGEFYLFKESCYNRMDLIEMEDTVVSFFHENRKKVSKSSVANFILNLRSIIKIASSINFGESISGKRVAPLPFKNGYIDLESNAYILNDVSDDLFITGVHPVNYDPETDCPEFLHFLNFVLPCKKTQLFIQEWFGYNLTYDTTQQKFVILIGEGANGKSVLLTILKAMLGKCHFSTVSLQSFSDPKLRELIHTYGKKANIDEEIGAVDSSDEARLKAFVGGAEVTIDQKYKHSLEIKPTAKLIYAANTVPRMADKSNGLWRRLVIIKFLKTIPEEHQDKRYATQEYWQKELPGILNWSIEGLKRLRKNGCFTIPSGTNEIINHHKDNSNPVRLFFSEKCLYEEEALISNSELYDSYKAYCDEGGYRPMNKANFLTEVERFYPTAIRLNNPTKIGTERTRGWRNIRLIGKLDLHTGTQDTAISFKDL